MVLVMSAREDLLDALEGLLIDDGERAATLEAVAARAGGAGGGLPRPLRPAPPRLAGPAARGAERAAADLEAMAADPAGPSAYYVRSSNWEAPPFGRTLVAASRLSWADDAPVRQAFAEVRASWLRLILEEVGDPAAAEAIMLIGDGLYYNALLAGDQQTPDSLAGLLAVVARLRDGAAGS